MKTLRKVLRIAFMIIGIYLLMWMSKEWWAYAVWARVFIVSTAVMCFYYALDAF